MKIKSSPNTTRLSTLKPGDTFRFHASGPIFMMLDEHREWDTNMQMCATLHGGSIGSVKSDTEVIPVNCTVEVHS